MKTTKQALGKGLASLISDSTMTMLKGNSDTSHSSQTPQNYVFETLIENLEANPDQPRKEIDAKALEDLSSSIAMHGILQPLLVRKLDVNRYQIIAGERRWRAAAKAGIKSVPIIVKNIEAAALAEVSIIENIQREDLKPLEEANAYQMLIENFGYTQENLSLRLGKSRTHVTNMLRLLKLPTSLHNMINTNQLSTGHARALINSSQAEDFANRIIEEKLTVRQTEKMVRNSKKHDHFSQDESSFQIEEDIESKLHYFIENRATDDDVKQLEDVTGSKLGTDVMILNTSKHHYLIIKSDQLEKIDRILSLLNT